MDSVIKIFIASGNSILLEHYCELLNFINYNDLKKINSGKELIDNLNIEPDIIFLDHRLDDYDGVRYVSEINRICPSAQIVLLSNPEDGKVVSERVSSKIFDHIIKDENNVLKIKETLGKYMATKEYIGRVGDPGMSNGGYMRIIAEAQERVRKHVSGELHDNVNQLLGATKLYIETARIDKHNSSELLKESRNILESAINEIRRISHSLNNVFTTTDSFSESVSNLLLFLRNQSKFNVQCNIDIDLIESFLDANQQHHITRILQELVNNIIKYSAAKTIILKADIVGEMLQLLVSDDGKGFERNRIGSSYGVTNVIARVKNIAGNYYLITAPGEGCIWKINIPVKEQYKSISINMAQRFLAAAKA